MENNNLPVKYKESIWKKIINKMKNLIVKNNNDKKIYEVTSKNIEFDKKDSHKEYRENSKIDLQNIKEDKRLINGTIEYALNQFNYSLDYQYKHYGKVNSYSALVNLGANAIQPSNGNDITEKTLIETLNSNDSRRKFDVHEQTDKKGNVIFYHVHTLKYIKDECQKNPNQMRLYINCSREYVSTLAGELLSKMQDDEIYLKFMSDKLLGKKERSEALVIYTDTKSVSQIINKINQIQNEKPNLFKNSENTNPFLKRIDGIIGYAPEPTIDEYYGRDGKIKKVPKSYNSFLSKALEESFIRTAKEYIANDKELTLKTRRGNI